MRKKNFSGKWICAKNIGDYIFVWNETMKENCSRILTTLIHVGYSIIIRMTRIINKMKMDKVDHCLPTGCVVSCDWPLASFLLVTWSDCISLSSRHEAYFISLWFALVIEMWEVMCVISRWSLLKNLICCCSFLPPRQPALSRWQKRQQPEVRWYGTEFPVIYTYLH